MINNNYSETEAVKALQGQTYGFIATSAQTLLKSGPGYLHGVLFTSNNISSLAFYDNVVSGGTTIATFPASAMASGPWFQLDVNFNTGLVISSGSTNTALTISYI